MHDHDWSRVWHANKNWAIAGLAVLVILLIIWSLLTKTPPSTARANQKVVGFYQDYSVGSGHPGSQSSFQSHVRNMSSVSPLWFSVEPAGSVKDVGYDPSVAGYAVARGVRVLPLFTNAAGSSAVLFSAQARSHAVTHIVALVNADHFSGVNIDFELLKASARNDFSRFIALLGSNLHAEHKTLAVSVFPLVGVPYSINGADDYRSLSHSADYLVIMTYDHHYSGGPPGPVAPWAWVKENIKAALKRAPASHLVLAIGMYGYDWVDDGKPGPAPTVPDEAVGALARQYHAHPHYDASDSQNIMTYTTAAGVKHIVYYMGNRSAKARSNLASSYHLVGVALWRLGFEAPGFWTMISGK